MTDETARHFDSVRRVARHQAEQEWLRQAYEMLARQQAIFDALERVARIPLPVHAREGEYASERLGYVARVMYLTCDSIMRHSGLTGLDRSDWGDQAASKSGEAREETVPW